MTEMHLTFQLQHCWLLQELLVMLDDDSTLSGDPIALTLRGFTYQTLGQLAQRAPSVFASDASLAERMFAALGTEPQGVRTSVQGAVSVLASAYKGCAEDVREKIELLLLHSIKSGEVLGRAVCGACVEPLPA